MAIIIIKKEKVAGIPIVSIENYTQLSLADQFQ